MKILDQRNFYSSKKLCVLGEWNGRTVVLEQTEQPQPFIRILLLCDDMQEESIFSASLRDRVLRQYILHNNVVRMLFSSQQTVQMVDFQLNVLQAEQEDYSFCGDVTDACLAGKDGCFVRTEENQTNRSLYRELKQMSGRNSFLFYCEPKNQICVPVRDFRLADLMPRRIEMADESPVAVCGIYDTRMECGQTEYYPPMMQNCVMWALWEPLYAALQQEEGELPLQFVLSAKDDLILRLGSESNFLYWLVQNGQEQKVFSLERRFGYVQEIAKTMQSQDRFGMVRGLGCCRITCETGRLQILPLNRAEALYAPEKIGIPAAWMEERFLISYCGQDTVCYDTQEKKTTVYEGHAQLLPDGILLS